MPECPGALSYAHMRDGKMIRLRFPGGQIPASQIQTIVQLSSQYGSGLIDLTNRANFQVRGLKDLTDQNLSDILGQDNIICSTDWADRLRNIMADPIPHTPQFDHHQNVAQQLDQMLQDRPSLKNLSPKFCFIIDNGGPYHIAKQSHDLAVIHTLIGNKPAYRLSIAKQLTNIIVAPSEAATLLLDLTDFICQNAPELKRGSDLLQKYGHQIETLALEIAPFCTIEKQFESQAEYQAPPLGLLKQQNSDKVTLGVGVPVSRLTAQQLSLLAEISVKYGNSTINLSPWQIIYLPQIAPEHSEKILQTLSGNGFRHDQQFLRYQVYACSGQSGCQRTQAHSKEEGFELSQQLKELPQSSQTSPTDNNFIIHISGCERGCGFAGKADLLALAQPEGGYSLYQNKSLSEIRNKPDQKGHYSEGNITKIILGQIDNNEGHHS